MTRRHWTGGFAAVTLAAAALHNVNSQSLATGASPPADSTYVVMLGTGTPNADPERSGPAVAVVRGERSYLIDAGPGIVRRASAAAASGTSALRPPNLRTLFLTHLHSDHTVGLPDVMLSAWTLERTVPLEVYGPPGTKALVDHLLAAYAADIRNRLNGLEPANTTGHQVTVHEIADGFVYRDGDLTVRAFAVPHGDWEHAFRLSVRGARPDDRDFRRYARERRGGPRVRWLRRTAARGVLRRAVQGACADWQRSHANAHTSTVELAALATRARPLFLVLYHQLYWGTDDAGLIAELRAAGYTGSVVSARDGVRYR